MVAWTEEVKVLIKKNECKRTIKYFEWTGLGDGLHKAEEVGKAISFTWRSNIVIYKK